jgi:hypothetical protein
LQILNSNNVFHSNTLKMADKHSWEIYGVKDRTNFKQYSDSNFAPFSKVTHITHLEHANRILKDRLITAGLIYDKSKLNKERILVNWLSPNYWFNGSRYGNVEFMFDFEALIKDKRYYWVETIDYSPIACRILITDKDYSDRLSEYNPAVDNGPWIYESSNGVHHRNISICLEFMVESNFSFDQIQEINFVNHHDYQCNISPKSCTDKGLTRELATFRFISSIVAHDLPIAYEHFTFVNAENDNEANNHVKNLCLKLYSIGRNAKCSGNVTSKDEVAQVLVKAALHRFAIGQYKEVRELVALFASHKDFIESFQEVFMDKFMIHDFNKLYHDI